MFIGHFAPAFAAAALDKHPNGPKLATYFVAAQLIDLALFTLALLGVEKLRIEAGATAMNALDLYHMPYTHSLVGAGVWAGAMAIFIVAWKRNVTGALLAALVVVSHWLLDWVVHRPDLTLMGTGPKLGLGLWDVPAAAIALELALILAAFTFYVRRTRGPILPPLALLGVMLIFQAINWFGPEPETAGPLFYLQALAAFAILTAIAAWVGENRYFIRRGGLAISRV